MSFVAKATIDLIEEDRLMDNADVVGHYYREALEGLQEKFEPIGDVRGMGDFLRPWSSGDCVSKEPDAAMTNKFMERVPQPRIARGKVD